MKYFLILFFLLLGREFIGQKNLNFYLIYNNSDVSSSEIKKQVSDLIENSKIKKLNIKVIHYSDNENSYDSWLFGKTEVEYNSLKKDCNFNLCDKLSSLFSFAQTSKSKLYEIDNDVNCLFSMESVNLLNGDEKSIIEKLDENILVHKKSKAVQSIFFVFNVDKIYVKPELYFDPDTITVKEGEKVILSPKTVGQISAYTWAPADGLSCTDCMIPELFCSKSSIYNVSVRDSIGCNHASASVYINVERDCQCGDDLKKIQIPFGELPIKKYIKKESYLTAEWDWKVLSNQSGGYVFDLLTTPNCSKTFRLKVFRSDGDIIYDEYYSREEVDVRSRNNYHELYPEYFVFRVDLSDDINYQIIEDVENNPYFIIEIISIDDSGFECTDKKYISPKIRPTKCN